MIIAFILLFFAILYDTYLFTSSAINFRKGRQSMKWPSTQAFIRKSFVEKSTYRTREGGSQTAYWPNLQYRYIVNEREYWGDRINFGISYTLSISTGEAKAQEVCSRYLVDSYYQVFYNPERPNESVLEPGSTEAAYGLAISLLIALIIGFVWIRVL
jgi:hypothetical protein